MDFSLAANLVSGLTSASEMIKSLRDLKADNDYQNKVIDLQNTILSVQSNAIAMQVQQAALADENKQLRGELKRAHEWEIERERYRLHSIDAGVFAFALRASKHDGEPPHWLCTSCFEARRKTILVPSPGLTYRMCCHICNSAMHTSFGSVPVPRYVDN